MLKFPRIQKQKGSTHAYIVLLLYGFQQTHQPLFHLHDQVRLLHRNEQAYYLLYELSDLQKTLAMPITGPIS